MFMLAACYMLMLFVGWDLAGSGGDFNLDQGGPPAALLSVPARPPPRPARLPSAALTQPQMCSLCARLCLGAGWGSTWVKMAASWLCAALYTWSLVAHRVLSGREF